MSIKNFIPQIWSARVLAALQKSLIYAQAGVVNRDYEGEISAAGDTVRINSIGDVTIKDYTRNADIEAPEELSDAQTMLTITQEKYFNFAVDDVDKRQAKGNYFDEAMQRSGYGLRDKADQFIAAKYTDVPTANMLGDDTTPIVPTATTAYEKLVDLGVILSENNVPKEGRFAIVPPWFYGLLQKDDRFVKAGTMKTDEVLRNGQIGSAAGFTVMESNNVPNTAGTKYKIIAGHPMAASYAEQIVKVEAYRPEKRFSDAVKGLHVYGAKLVRPYAWAVLTANKS
jgi:N4-gp56 family major capsid protein